MSIEITNFIHGERVAAAGGETTELTDPSPGVVYGYGKDLSMYGLEEYTRIKHVMSYIERRDG